jgi:hypothetical protein
MANASTIYYADDVPTLHNQVSQYNVDEPKHRPKLLLFQCPGGTKNYIITNEEKDCIMLYVLMNMNEVVDFAR